jgi:hypothetical protein
MASRQDLIDEIQATLGPSISAQIASASAANDIFEAYIWALLVDAARNEGAGLSFRDFAGNSVPSLTFRTSPGAIYSTANPYSYARLEFNGCPTLEAHLGIFVSGRSGVPHECDVAVVEEAEANTCRQSQVHPRSSKVLLSVECKFYSTNLRIDLARSFLGLTEEIQQKDRFFVSNASSGSVAKMLTSHDRRWETRVSPLNQRLQRRLVGYFETTFKHYKARNT